MTLPTTHRRALGVAAVIGLVGILLYYVWIFPVQKSNRDLRQRNEQQRTDLRASGFPLNPPQLDRIRVALEQQEEAVTQAFDAMYDLANAGMKERIEQQYYTMAMFRKQVRQIDYAEQFLALEQTLAHAGIFLDSDTLGISAKSSRHAHNYQLLAQLWVVHDIALLAKAHSLTIGDPSLIKSSPETTDKQRQERESRPPAHITVLPVKAYTVRDGVDPFVEEYAVKVVVRGKVGDLCTFLEQLTSGNHFLPLDRIAVRKIGLETPRADTVEATIVCGSFMMIETREKLIKPVPTSRRSRRTAADRGA